MTKIHSPVTRETLATVRDAGRRLPLVVTIDVDGIWLRQKGRRTAFNLPYETAWDHAVKAHVRAARLRKLEERSTRKRGA